MKNLPIVGQTYTDRHGFSVLITAVIKSGGGAGPTGDQRKSKLTGYRVEMLHGSIPHTLGLQQFDARGFKCTSL